ncbi:MAG TPA: GAF domain-containing protein, partial [Vicinamibacterales bacterium]
LDAALTQRRGSLAETIDVVDQLAAAERRTRDYARRGETLLAGDVVFTEVRDLVATSIEQVQTARNILSVATAARISALRREQAMLAGGAIAAWAIIALLLVTPTKPVAVKDPNEWRNDLAATIKKPIPKEPETAKLKPVVELPAPAVPVEPVPAVPSVPVVALLEVGEICADLSTLADTGALTGALDRAAKVLDAGGVIVWIASNDGNTLSPVASHGFDQKMVSRIGRIPRDSANLTAAAFRDNVSRVSAATATAPAALAVALCGPSGPVGVLSVELKAGIPADEARVALATIFAAQLATLAQPIAVPAAPAAPVAPAAPASSRVAL